MHYFAFYQSLMLSYESCKAGEMHLDQAVRILHF